MATLLFNGDQGFTFDAMEPGLYVEVTDAARTWYVSRYDGGGENPVRLPRMGAGVFDLQPSQDAPAPQGRFEYKIRTESDQISLLLYPHYVGNAHGDFVWTLYMLRGLERHYLRLPFFVYPEPAVPMPAPDPPERFEREEVI